MMMILTIVLALGVVGGLVLRKNQNPAGTPVLLICCILAVVAAVVRLVGGVGGVAPQERLQDDLEVVRQVMVSELGRYLAGESAGTRALCILPSDGTGEVALQSGLREGLNDQIPVAFALLQRDETDELDIVNVTAAKVAAMLDQHPGTDLLICTADLPYDGRELAALLRDRQVQLAATSILAPGILTPYSRAEVLAGAVVHQEDPGDLAVVREGSSREIFDSQFILVPGRSQ